MLATKARQVRNRLSITSCTKLRRDGDAVDRARLPPNGLQKAGMKRYTFTGVAPVADAKPLDGRLSYIKVRKRGRRLY